MLLRTVLGEPSACARLPFGVFLEIHGPLSYASVVQKRFPLNLPGGVLIRSNRLPER